MRTKSAESAAFYLSPSFKSTKEITLSLQELVEKGRRPTPPRMLIYGQEGVGKSSLGARAPEAVFIPTEDGLSQIDCQRFPVATSFDDVMNALGMLFSEEHSYQTLVVDSLDWLESLIWDKVCRDYGAKTIDKVDGGFGRGYNIALVNWRSFLDGIDALHKQRGMMILFLAHAKVERFEDPEASAYDRYSPRLHKAASALITEWCDAVLFATRRFRVDTESGGFNRNRGIAKPIGADGGDRILRTIGGPSCLAKNRFNLPSELTLDWDTLFSAITGELAHG